MAVTTLTLTSLATSLYKNSASGNAANSIKASGGNIFMVNVDNSANAAIEYVKLYATAGAVVVGTTAPDWVLLVPASFVGALFIAPAGLAFPNGLQEATVTAGGTAGVTSPSSSLILQVVFT